MLFFHVERINKIIIGKISSLPIRILVARTIFEKSLKSAKFSIGPTLEKPGPTLFMQVTTAVIVVVKSKLSTDINNEENPIISI